MSRRHISNLVWTQALADDLPRWQAWRFRRHLRRCRDCRASFAELCAERAADAATMPPLVPSAGARHDRVRPVSARAPSRPFRTSPWAGWASAGALAAALAAVWLRPVTPEALRRKGTGSLTLFVERPAGVEPLGDTCAAGDRLAARFVGTGRFVMIVEVDGTGHAQVVYPSAGEFSARVPPAGQGDTDESFILDDAPGVERFVALFSDAPLSAPAALEAVEHGPWPSGVTLAEARCQKVP